MCMSSWYLCAANCFLNIEDDTSPSSIASQVWRDLEILSFVKSYNIKKGTKKDRGQHANWGEPE